MKASQVSRQKTAALREESLSSSLSALIFPLPVRARWILPTSANRQTLSAASSTFSTSPYSLPDRTACTLAMYVCLPLIASNVVIRNTATSTTGEKSRWSSTSSVSFQFTSLTNIPTTTTTINTLRRIEQNADR